MHRTCIDCGANFWAKEQWKVRCIRCWRLNRADARESAKRWDVNYREPPIDVNSELNDRVLRRLLQLCHPDKHEQSSAAVEATQWLNNMRQRLASQKISKRSS